MRIYTRLSVYICSRCIRMLFTHDMCKWSHTFVCIMYIWYTYMRTCVFVFTRLCAYVCVCVWECVCVMKYPSTSSAMASRSRFPRFFVWKKNSSFISFFSNGTFMNTPIFTHVQNSGLCSQVSLQTAHLKRNMNFDNSGFQFELRWQFQVHKFLPTYICKRTYFYILWHLHDALHTHISVEFLLFIHRGRIMTPFIYIYM